MCFIPIVKPFLIHWFWLRLKPFTWTGIGDHGRSDRSTWDAYSHTHLIPPLVFPGVRVTSLIFTVSWIAKFTWSVHWFWLRISSVYLIWRTDFDCVFFRLPNLDTLTNGLRIWNGAHGGCDRSTGMLTPPRHLIPPLVFPEVRVCSVLGFVFPTGFMRLITFRYLCHFINNNSRRKNHLHWWSVLNT
jgi:hypothetical protein